MAERSFEELISFSRGTGDYRKIVRQQAAKPVCLTPTEAKNDPRRVAEIVLGGICEMRGEVIELADPDGDRGFYIPIEAAAEGPSERVVRKAVGPSITDAKKGVGEGCNLVRAVEQGGTKEEVVVMSSDSEYVAVVAVEIGSSTQNFGQVRGGLALPPVGIRALSTVSGAHVHVGITTENINF